jgi:hypothetical protein
VGPDPKPYDYGTFEDGKRTVSESDTNGINILLIVDLLEPQTRMRRIRAKQHVGSPSLVLNVCR